MAHVIREEENYREMEAVLDAEEDFVVSEDEDIDGSSGEESCGNEDCLCSGSESVSNLTLYDNDEPCSYFIVEI